MSAADAAVERLDLTVCTVPTEEPESDGTLEWEETTCVIVQVHAAREVGLGYSYTGPAAARLIEERLSELVRGADPLRVSAIWEDMVAAVRNFGRPGIASSAIAAVDTALWDLKARLLGLSLVDLLGPLREEVPVYASGGFTSYSAHRLAKTAEGWLEEGHRRAKIKIGRDREVDRARVRAFREAAGGQLELFADANGAFHSSQALAVAWELADEGVTWFEEPVSSDDLDDMRRVRQKAPPGMDITAGEYGYDSYYFLRMLRAGAVDVLMPDATRCAGVTGFLRAAALSDAFQVPVSAHTAPALHLHVAAACPRVRHIEWFHDHVLVERQLFDGVVEPVAGSLVPDRSRPGMGLELRPAAARRFAA